MIDNVTLEGVASTILCLAIALILTIIIEWAISFIFLRSRSDRILVALVQVLTNPALNLLLMINRVYKITEQLPALICLEIIVVLLEGFIYKKGIKGTKINPFVLSLVLNLASFFIGLFVVSQLAQAFN